MFISVLLVLIVQGTRMRYYYLPPVPLMTAVPSLAWAERGLVYGHREVLVVAARVTPEVLVETDHGDLVEPVFVVDEHPPSFGQDSSVRGVPGDSEALGDSGDGQVLSDQPRERPPQSTP